jgi:hypothetical protein
MPYSPEVEGLSPPISAGTGNKKMVKKVLENKQTDMVPFPVLDLIVFFFLLINNLIII